ncbi:4a-hydroxytetrahydrobiopterin dehydratase [Marinactinospora thermotolerans]|uniref:Putative pterin-4-alpha-carbinolamine dehydratase n=1 Tax=Marinactinospora thermotolerans DSM 45154 TaxID=1122192 RepID=A0A1T4PVX8_9ACTN|nr:4a-hydroxytetrahydrobiopterin dehydratase [Marinactinospora thermotolerans]SJZ95714.1 4a-hydroxytetrahydrobiopterin dehydratase [Marinactinospora thermotolerans DSM 45154]
MAVMDDAEITAALAGLDGWERVGDEIRRTVHAPDFPGGIEWVNAVAHAAQEAGHHPDIDIRYNQVTFALTTHAVGAITERDIDLAARIDRIVAQR